MSTVINLVEDHNIYLCEGGPVYNGGVQPTPIIYLTQWRMMGNSVVHTDEYLTQWKVEGNSAVSNPNANLPQGYKKCKYLESHGTEYIELPFGFDKTDEVYANAALVDLTRISDMFLVAPKTWNDGDNRYGLGCHYNFGVAYGSKSTSQTTFSPLRGADVDVHTYSYANELFTFDGGVGSRDVSNITFGSTTDNLRLFHTYNADVKWRIYAYHHVKANNVEVNLIPCLDDNDVPCLYDTVSNTAFYNDGTGTFGYELEQPTILSCGDLGQDGKYHVKISNGVTIYDIPLTEPLRKVNDVADSIEFADGVATLTRSTKSVKWSDIGIAYHEGYKRFYSTSTPDGIFIPTDNISRLTTCLSGDFIQSTAPLNANDTDMCMIAYSSDSSTVRLYIRDLSIDTPNAFQSKYGSHELLYRLETPTTETIQVPQIAVSPTDTYTSANDTPYSAFEYKKNVEIWSCGEYSAVDGKYHILVQPQGGSIADIALDEPLRKVNDVADKIEFADGVATVTRYYMRVEWQTIQISKITTSGGVIYFALIPATPYEMGYTENQLSNAYPNYKRNSVSMFNGFGMGLGGSNTTPIMRIVNSEIENMTESEFAAANTAAGIEIIYELATPTTEVIQVPQIEEADSYSCIISQGGKAVSWSSFETE